MDLLFRSGASIIIRNKTDEGKLEIYEDHFIFLGKLYAINGKVDTNYLNYNKTTISKGFVFTSSGQSVLHISFSNMQSIDIIRMDQNKEEELIQLIDSYHSKKEKIENGEKGPKEGNAAVSQGQETVAKLTAQQLKALEMKKRLQEAEKRRQTIEEENKRIEEEERKRKEEEERRQREEAERKRKEEEERKRREEEELKRRQEEERKRKEEEERKRREEAEKRRLEKLKQREERIATAVTNAKEKAVDLSGKIARVRIDCSDSADFAGVTWTSGWADLIDAETGLFDIEVFLQKNKMNHFKVFACDSQGTEINIENPLFDIKHNENVLKNSAPPATMSIGVKIQDPKTGNDILDIVIMKNTPLPASAERKYKTTKDIRPFSDDCIKIEILEGENIVNPNANSPAGTIYIQSSQMDLQYIIRSAYETIDAPAEQKYPKNLHLKQRPLIYHEKELDLQ